MLRLGVGNLARVGELGGDFLEVVELGEVGFVAHRDQQEVTTFFGLANAENLHAWGGLGEFVVVMVNVLRVGENVRRSDDVSEDFFRCRNGRGGGKMIDQVGEKERLGCVFANLFCVSLIIRRVSLSAQGSCAETQNQQSAGKKPKAWTETPHHRDKRTLESRPIHQSPSIISRFARTESRLEQSRTEQFPRTN